MEKISLTALARHELNQAMAATSGRSAKTVIGGHQRRLRQTVIALRAGTVLDDHENPGEATVQVLGGRVTLRFGDVMWNGSTGDLLTVPDGVHSLEAIESSTVLLTVVKDL